MVFVKEQRILPPDKKIVGPKNFSMESLKFSDAWEILVGEQNRLH